MRIGEVLSTMSKMVNTYNNLNALSQKSIQRISTGKRINSAADDPAAVLQISKLESKINELSGIQKGIQDGISLLQTIDKTYENMSTTAQKLVDLASQYNNGTLSDSDKKIIEEQAKAYLNEIINQKNNTTFNGMNVFSKSQYNIYRGISGNSTINIPKFDISYDSTTDTYSFTDNNGNVISGKNISEILNTDFIQNNIINPISQARSYIGTQEDILEKALNFEQSQEIIAQQTLSTIQDVNIEEEKANLAMYQTQMNIITQLMSNYSNMIQKQMENLFNTTV